MTRIAVLGGTGYTGGHIVQEAAGRGHHVTSYSRHAPGTPIEGVHHLAASMLEEGAVAAAVAGQDVVVEALAPRGELAGQLEGLIADLALLAAEQGARLIVIGGWSGLRPAAGEPRFVDGDVPEAFRAEAEEMVRALDALERSAPQGLDWVFVSPAQRYGSYAPGEALGHYRVSGPVAILDADGTSALSGADLALAVIDEIERHEHSGHIGVAY
jgi:putative NADH-flavin reductase